MFEALQQLNGRLIRGIGDDGIPVLVPPNGEQLVKRAEANEKAPSSCFRVRLFDMAKPDDVRDFTTIHDKAITGAYRLHRRIDKWDDVANGPRIWLEWVELYKDMTNGAATRDATAAGSVFQSAENSGG